MSEQATMAGDALLNSFADNPFSSFFRISNDLARMALASIEPRPEVPRAVPVTLGRDGVYYLVALDFETPDAAENFRSGLEEHCDRDGRRLFLKNPCAVNRDECGNCSGIN
jgi:hypothetical protein